MTDNTQAFEPVSDASYPIVAREYEQTREFEQLAAHRGDAASVSVEATIFTESRSIYVRSRGRRVKSSNII